MSSSSESDLGFRPTRVMDEEVLRRAREVEDSVIPSARIRWWLTDPPELADPRVYKRRSFEDQISIRRHSRFPFTPSEWIEYAQWEESHDDLVSARSVFDRAIDANHKYILYNWYADPGNTDPDFHMSGNVYTHLTHGHTTEKPRIHWNVDQIWSKYIHMEESLGNIDAVRRIFDRWMVCWALPYSKKTNTQVLLSYIKFEMSHGGVEPSRAIFERFLACKPTEVSAWIEYARFEKRIGEMERARAVYERATSGFALQNKEAEMLFAAYAEFEKECGEVELARQVYNTGLDPLPKERTGDLRRQSLEFEEKQNGDSKGIDNAKKTFHSDDDDDSDSDSDSDSEED